MVPSMKSLPLTIRTIKATEARLESIYQAANLGLKGDALAMHAGMLPEEYRQLCELDPAAKLAALKGKADAEAEHALLLANASRAGDAKASLAILQHQHGWQSRETQSANFGSSGITINIGTVAVPDHHVIEGERVD